MQPALDIQQQVRTDPLTGIGNLLGFADLLMGGQADDAPYSLIAVDVHALSNLEQSQGDNALRWVALVLSDELPAPVFRVAGDEFVAILTGAEHQAHRDLADRLARRLDLESGRLGLQRPAVWVSVVHFSGGEPRTPADTLGRLQAAVAVAKRNPDELVTGLPAGDLAVESELPTVVNRLIERLVGLGSQLEAAQHLAFTDPVTSMPNMRAALQRSEEALALAAAQHQPLALLLIDGDNLRRYNEIGYAAGDRMLIDLSTTLREQLRPSDFLARWRIGDEFLVILPNTGVSGATTLAERLRRRVELISQYWPFPVTISTGVAVFPQHGNTIDLLIDRAEEAKQRAKVIGKNCIVVAQTHI